MCGADVRPGAPLMCDDEGDFRISRRPTGEPGCYDRRDDGPSRGAHPGEDLEGGHRPGIHPGSLSRLDVASRKEIKRVDTGGGGSSILITPDGSQAYIGMTGADKVAALDLGKLEVVSEIKTGDGPDGMD